MGPIAFPGHGAIYLDASAIIYSVERNDPYFTMLAPAWRASRSRPVLGGMQ